MRPAPLFARTVALLTVCLAGGLSACGGATEPVSAPRGPALVAYYAVDGVDGHQLPTPAVSIGIGDSLVTVSLVRAALTLDPLYTKWEMDLGGAVSAYSEVLMRPRGPVVIGRDSVEVYLSAAAVPVLVGRFTDTSLVLRPVGGITRPAAPIDSLGAHSWRLRPSGPLGS